MTTNIRQIVEQRNWYELYNSYALWIRSNKWAWKNGGNTCSTPFDVATSPYGMREFYKANFGDEQKKWVNIEAAASKQLNKYPEIFAQKANIFAKMFPGVITAKLKKNAKVEEKTNKTLNEFFEQKSLPFTKTETVLTDLAQTICALAERGAKTIKTPDGWEIQF